MKFATETPLRYFGFWGGAESNAQLLTLSQLDMLDEILGEMYSDGWEISQTRLNDMFRFDFDYIATLLGFKDAEDLERAARGESDE